MAGGTGGHVFPGLAVAKFLKTQNIEVHWLGTSRGLEATLVPSFGIPLHFIKITGIRGKKWKDIIFAPIRILFAVLQALKIIHTVQPDIVIGMGGFVSGPGGIASFIMKTKLIIHEQNAKPGLTNKYLAYLAAKILAGFPHTFSNASKVITIGNPIRTEIANIPPPEVRFAKLKKEVNMLIIGGSLGAEVINNLLPKVISALAPAQRPMIWHQTGEKNLANTIKNYKDCNVQAKIDPFIKDMGAAYLWADIIVSRAGALTVAEICAAGLPSILIPYPHAVDDHQTANANFLVKKNAAYLIPQKELNKELLLSYIQTLCGSAERRLSMAKAAYSLRQIEATSKVWTVCKEVCR